MQQGKQDGRLAIAWVGVTRDLSQGDRKRFAVVTAEVDRQCQQHLGKAAGGRFHRHAKRLSGGDSGSCGNQRFIVALKHGQGILLPFLAEKGVRIGQPKPRIPPSGAALHQRLAGIDQRLVGLVQGEQHSRLLLVGNRCQRARRRHLRQYPTPSSLPRAVRSQALTSGANNSTSVDVTPFSSAETASLALPRRSESAANINRASTGSCSGGTALASEMASSAWPDWMAVAIARLAIVRSLGSAVAIIANSRAERASSPSISAARAST